MNSHRTEFGFLRGEGFFGGSKLVPGPGAQIVGVGDLRMRVRRSPQSGRIRARVVGSGRKLASSRNKVPNSQKLANIGPNSAKIGPLSPNKEVEPDLGKFRRKLVEIEPELAKFAQIWPNSRHNLPTSPKSTEFG